MATLQVVGGVTAGLVTGSLAGAAMMRWPVGHTLRAPRRSACTGCGTPIGARDLIPVLSYVLLRGRCRRCAQAIDRRIPILELGTGLLVGASVARHGVGLVALLLTVALVATALAAAIDAKDGIIPDRLTRPLALLLVPATLALAVRGDGTTVPRVVGWSLALPALLHLLNRVMTQRRRPRPIGGGDLKLLVGVLAPLALPGGSPARFLVATLMLAGSVAAVGLMLGWLRRGDRLAMGPALLVGLCAEVLLWHEGVQ
jgi:leader peptidase (prepilin peptidase) / N-methyltransferase